MPPESSCGRASARFSSSAEVSSSSILPSARIPWYTACMTRFSRTVSSPSRFCSWGTTPIRDLISRRWVRASSPSTRSSPPSMLASP